MRPAVIKVLVSGLVGTVVGIVIMVAVIAIAGTDTEASSSYGLGELPSLTGGETTAPTTGGDTGGDTGGGPDLTAGKELFTGTCGGCHTLADAGTAGAVGPNLDDLAPDQQRVLDAIANGGTGSGTMPPGLFTGADAEAVAAYVSSVAGG